MFACGRTRQRSVMGLPEEATSLPSGSLPVRWRLPIRDSTWPLLHYLASRWLAFTQPHFNTVDKITATLNYAQSMAHTTTLHSSSILTDIQLKLSSTNRPNDALHQTRRERRGCNPWVPWAGSLSLAYS